ncbi:MAG: MlaD family protein [Solirubrobacteraceae bacterium]
MKRLLASATVVILAGAFVFLASGASGGNSSSSPTFKIEFDNAFGLVTGADFKVAGVKAGTIKSIDLDQKNLHAVVTVDVTQPGFGSFHSDAFCQSRPQSLIGEYFVSCEPGNRGPALRSGSTIPVQNTESTIPADLLQDIMRLPYRERFTLVVNELGAGVAARSGDLQAALHRAVPALTETDNLLNLLANDSHTLQALTVNSDAVITALANNSPQVQRFIDEANNAASDTATQQANLQSTFQRLPAFLEQLRPSLQRLGQATDANLPVLSNLNSASGEIDRLLIDLPKFANGALPAIRSLGKASVTGKVAVQAAGPMIRDLNRFARPTPELAQNLAIVLHDLDDRSRASEPEPRSPGGKGYTGLEALLQFVFNLGVATNSYGPFGHSLAVDGFVSAMCSPYATPGTIAMNLKSFGAAYRSCYAWLGKHQPGVNVTDPSNPTACVPDPGGAPPGESGPAASNCKLAAADVAPAKGKRAKAASGSSQGRAGTGSLVSTSGSAPGTAGSSTPGGTSKNPPSLQQALGAIVGLLGIPGASGSVPSGSSGSGAGSDGSSQNGSSGSAVTTASGAPNQGGQTRQLLNYLLAP